MLLRATTQQIASARLQGESPAPQKLKKKKKKEKKGIPSYHHPHYSTPKDIFFF
jgi:hypothetical protein